MKDLKVAHNILLKSQDFTKINRFDELDNLKGSDHFIVNLNEDSKTYIMDIGKMKDNNFIENKGLPKPPDNNDLKDWSIVY